MWRECAKLFNRPCLDDDRCMGGVCRRFDVPDGELLSIAEKEVLTKLGDIYNDINAIIGVRSKTGDRAELVSHIHNLQRMVMSQAAARRYPELFRLLGES